jgi:hypothetical protein
MLRLVVAFACCAPLALSPAAAGAKPAALVVFVGAGGSTAMAESDRAERLFESLPELSSAIVSATQGSYSTTQMLLDMTQGARVSNSAYSPSRPPSLSLFGNRIEGWEAAVARADEAPQLLEPGLLAAQAPGGGAYAGVRGASNVDAALAADRGGRVAAVSLGPAATLRARIERLAKSHRLVVADLPSEGYPELRALLAARPASELIAVAQRVRERPDRLAGKGGELLWMAFAGLGRGGQTLTSQTTNERGMIAAIDLAPTILDHLGLAVPADMRGKPVSTDGAFDGAALRALKARLGVISGRRLPALGWLLFAWAALLAGARLVGPGAGGARAYAGGGVGRGGVVGVRSGRPREAWAMRVGALALLWAPVGTLVTAAIEPSRTAEFVLLAAICLSLGALTDRALAWPRAPIAPAVVAVVAIVVDALAKTQLLMRSLLGPNPAFGARFYGIGNELKPGLAVLVLCAVAAALYPAMRGRRAAIAMAGAGIVLAVVEGSARIGAGVGGVVLVSAGTAVATTMLLEGALTRKRVLFVMLAPAAGLVALAAIDLATAHGGGHFTGSVLHARSAGDVRDILARRYGAAWDELRNHAMPYATGLALAAGGWGVARRERVCGPVGADPGWMAALCGGLTAGVVGALSEDSGPVLLVVAVGAVGCVVGYLWGRPLVGEAPSSLPVAPWAERGKDAGSVAR